MTNEPTIDTVNKTIAVFDGWQFIKGDPTHKCNFCFAGDEPCLPSVDRFMKEKLILVHYELKYHEDWNELIRVIKKIKGRHMDILQQTFVMDYMKAAGPMNSGLISLDIDKAHKGVYQFITWYNQQKQQHEK